MKKSGEKLMGALLSGRTKEKLNSVTKENQGREGDLTITGGIAEWRNMIKENQHGGMVRERVGFKYRLCI